MEAGIYLEISKATAYAGSLIQVSIIKLDEKGSGHGSRLAGPKYTSSGSRILRRIKIDSEFVKEISPYLAQVSP